MLRIKQKVRLPDGSSTWTTSDEAEKIRVETQAADEQREQARLDALQKSAGVYRVILSGPDGVFHLCTTNDPTAGEILRCRFPRLLEETLKDVASVQNEPRGKTTNSKPVRVMSVQSEDSRVKPGDRYESASAIARVLKVGNIAAYVNYSRNSGKKRTTVKGVTFCLEEDYASEMGREGEI